MFMNLLVKSICYRCHSNDIFGGEAVFHTGVSNGIKEEEEEYSICESLNSLRISFPTPYPIETWKRPEGKRTKMLWLYDKETNVNRVIYKLKLFYQQIISALV